MTNEQLAAEIQAGHTEHLETLWQGIERFVRKKAKYLSDLYQADNACSSDDLYQVGYFAMLKALQTFDPNGRKTFIGWFNWYLMAEFSAARGYQRRKHTYDPTRVTVSLETPIGEDNDSVLMDLLQDPDAQDAILEAETSAELYHVRKKLDEALDRLSPRRAEILRLRYYQCMTLQQAADKMNITRQRAHQLEQAALETLRNDAQICALDEAQMRTDTQNQQQNKMRTYRK